MHASWHGSRSTKEGRSSVDGRVLPRGLLCLPMNSMRRATMLHELTAQLHHTIANRRRSAPCPCLCQPASIT